LPAPLAFTGTDPVSAVMTLMATGRLGVVCVARKTSAVVPCAMSRGLSYPGSAGSSGSSIPASMKAGSSQDSLALPPRPQ
jgi:hypothetical protein